MVEPEIGEHFLELPLGVDRAQELLLAELDDDEVAALLDRIGHFRLAGRHVVFRVLLARAPRLDLRALDLLGDLSRAHLHGLEPGEPRGHAVVRNPFGAQLLVDVPLDADRADALDVAQARAKTNTAEDVDEELISGLVGRRRTSGSWERNRQNCNRRDKESLHCPVRPGTWAVRLKNCHTIRRLRWQILLRLKAP